MAEYLFGMDNKVHDITYDQLDYLFEDNQKESRRGQRMTCSSYGNENFYNKYGNTAYALEQEYIERDPRTSGVRIYYPHGVVIEQSQRSNYYRGENQLYKESMPTLLRKLKVYTSREEQELYRLIADMRVAEFKFFYKISNM